MDPSAALHRLKESRHASRQQQLMQHSAAKSDAENEAYLQELAAAFKQIEVHSTESLSSKSSTQPKPNLLQHDIRAASYQSIQQQRVPRHASPKVQGPYDDNLGPATSSAAVSSTEALRQSWRTGPVDEAGLLIQLSDRPLLCSAVAADGSGDVVVGSSDHALYVVDVHTGCKRRTLYSKSCGHGEWVTAVCCLPGGGVLSGGMDGQLWLWPPASSAGVELKGAHAAPVSKVSVLQQGGAVDRTLQTSSSSSSRAAGGNSVRRRTANQVAPALAVSCSYDKTVKLWQVTGRVGKQLAAMSGHTGPVLELAVASGARALVTGDRKGSIMCWDVNTASRSWAVQQAHTGHITALAWGQLHHQNGNGGNNDLALSGGQDGCLRVWDVRTARCVAHRQLHVDALGKGALGGIATVAGAAGVLLATMGADKTLQVLDPAASFKTLCTVPLTDFPYALAVPGDGLVVCGCGDGSVHVVDVQRGTTLYALGAGQAAIRCLNSTADSLVCSGDDGCVVVYTYL